MVVKLLIVGPPGSGKGTLCESLVRDFGLVHLSGGEILREEVKKGSKLGLEAAKYMKEGRLVPDAVMVQLMFSRAATREAQERGVIFDGFPRTLAQAKALTDAGLHFDAMVVLEVCDKALMERSLGRRLDPQTGTVYHLIHKPPPPSVVPRLVIRPDDTQEKQTLRMRIYAEQRDLLVSHFATIVVTVDANQSIEQVHDECLGKLRMQRGVKLQKAAAPSKL